MTGRNVQEQAASRVKKDHGVIKPAEVKSDESVQNVGSGKQSGSAETKQTDPKVA